MTIARHITEPTDRSKPPTTNIRVIPTTTMPSVENDSKMALRLGQVKKYGETKLMMIHTARIIKIRVPSRNPLIALKILLALSLV